MSRPQFEALLAPLSDDDKRELRELLIADERLLSPLERLMREAEGIAPPPLPAVETVQDNEDGWLAQYQARIRDAIAAHPDKELPSNLAATWKEVKRSRLINHF